MSNVFAWLLVLLVLLLLGILLQVFLSKRESWWPGLVLPGVTLLYAVVMVCNVAAVGGVGAAVMSAFITFCFANIPTLVLLAIYRVCRKKRRRDREMERMHLDDL